MVVAVPPWLSVPIAAIAHQPFILLSPCYEYLTHGGDGGEEEEWLWRCWCRWKPQGEAKLLSFWLNRKEGREKPEGWGGGLSILCRKLRLEGEMVSPCSSMKWEPYYLGESLMWMKKSQWDCRIALGMMPRQGNEGLEQNKKPVERVEEQTDP